VVLLGFCAAGHEDGADVSHTHVEQQRCSGPEAFDPEHVALQRIPSGAAELNRPGWGHPALLRENRIPALSGFDIRVDARCQTGSQFQLVIEVLGEKVPNHVAKSDGFGWQCGAHSIQMSSVLSNRP
jgi:hypothetical protein